MLGKFFKFFIVLYFFDRGGIDKFSIILYCSTAVMDAPGTYAINILDGEERSVVHILPYFTTNRASDGFFFDDAVFQCIGIVFEVWKLFHMQPLIFAN